MLIFVRCDIRSTLLYLTKPIDTKSQTRESIHNHQHPTMLSTISIGTDSESLQVDWRITLFGEFIQDNSTKTSTPAGPSSDPGPVDLDDLEAQPQMDLVPTETALDKAKYDYIAVFIGADYCPHCKAFAPTVKESVPALEKKKCKTIFVSNDRTKEAFQASCAKNKGIDVMPYDLEKTAYMRDLFGLKTIPALMILRNDSFASTTPVVVTNARNALPSDLKLAHFPWKKTPAASKSVSDEEEPMSMFDRIVISGKYGKWWELGHHANPSKPDEMYMDEHAVRIRAGLLNIVTWIALMNVWFWRSTNFVPILYPIVAFEFLVSANLGLGPIAPIGVLATIIASYLQPKPYWKPAKPKRFAWYIGLTLATTCLIIYLVRGNLSESVYRPLISSVAILCNIATWMESSCGFCIGCYIYNTWMVPMFNFEECSECKL
jgi:thiol-disulfide isomerase/thioredoxin